VSTKLRHLQDLAALKAGLLRAQQEAAEAEAKRREDEARAQRERDLFATSVGRVAPVADKGRIAASPTKPEPEPKQRQLDERAALKEAISDEFDAESLMETDDALFYRRDGIGIDIVRKLRRGRWTIQAQVDLHGLRRDEARERIAEFLRDAVKRGLRCVRVVHGKGNGSPGREPVLKGKVRTWLVQKQEVLAFVQARASDGGNGALVVLLKAGTPQPDRPV
jgi:DNA-nicking Smr family endonuclease